MFDDEALYEFTFTAPQTGTKYPKGPKKMKKVWV
jgi:hypothetical protein